VLNVASHDLRSSDPQVNPGQVSVATVGRWFKSGARNHLQANRSLGFCIEILI